MELETEMAEVRVRTKVLAGGRIDVVAPGLVPGTEVTVTVESVPSETAARPSPTVRELIGSARLAGPLDLDNDSIDRDLGLALLAELDGDDGCS